MRSGFLSCVLVRAMPRRRARTFDCSTSHRDEEQHLVFENQVKQLLGKVKNDHLRCFQDN